MAPSLVKWKEEQSWLMVRAMPNVCLQGNAMLGEMLLEYLELF